MKIKNYFLIKKYPFLQIRNVWTDEKIKTYDYIWLDDMPKGWKKLGLNLCKELKRTFKKSKEKNFIKSYRIQQVKEKYGSLRWYDNGIPKDISNEYDKIIEKYTELSEHTCIICGKKGEIDYDNFWLEPLCKIHYLKMKKEFK